MKKFIAMLVIAVVAVVVAACTSKKQEESEAKKSLVLYYSQTGATKAVAEEIQRLTGADIEAVDATEPYDGDFQATVERCQKEHAEGVLPTLKPLQVNLADYDVIYLGYPIWFGTYAPPIAALIDKQSFEGKTIVPFCTFGSGGLEASVRELRAKFPDVEILDGYGVRNARTSAIPQEVDRFLKENGLIEGEVASLAEFSEQQPVGETEKGLFYMACGNYQFPLGTPVSFGKRAIQDGTEYKFLVNAQSPDGQSTETTIYVTETLIEGDMVVVEFTKVVR